MKKIVLIGLFTLLALGFTNASEYNGSIDSSNGISTNSLDVTLSCSPSSVSNGSVNSTTCVITCNTNYTLSSNQCVANSGGGWGGGGGGGGGSTTSTTTGETITTETTTLGGEVDGIDLTVGDITDSIYSTELNDAYQFSFANGITTKKTIQAANMEGYLIRSHMAKIIVNYTIRVLGNRTPNTGLNCEFDDMVNETEEMKFYSKLVCQFGIMGIHPDGTPADNFNPTREVTRAEFGTVLSRLLYGSVFEGGSPYYKNHLSALKRVGIIKNTTPTNKELRGYVMLMLMRSNE